MGSGGASLRFGERSSKFSVSLARPGGKGWWRAGAGEACWSSQSCPVGSIEERHCFLGCLAAPKCLLRVAWV